MSLNAAELINAFDEVALRAKRLAEWIELEALYRQLVKGFVRFNFQVVTNSTPDRTQFTKDGLWEIFQTQWTDIDDYDFLGLDSFHGSQRNINQPLPDQNPAPWPIFTGLFQGVRGERRTNIQVAFTQRSAKMLNDACRAFNTALEAILVAHREQISKELKDLSDLTNRLKDRFRKEVAPPDGAARAGPV